MKDFSFFLLKNSIGAKMRKGFRSSCNGDGSTSTLNQRKINGVDYSSSSSCIAAQSDPFVDVGATSGQETRTTLEEMIFKLEFEEKMAAARKAKVADYYDDEYYNSTSTAHEILEQRRMSCVDNADILRSARNALNQYPRFSLDGKDAMYRSSFQNLPPPNIISGTAGSRKSFCCDRPPTGSTTTTLRKGRRSSIKTTIKEGPLHSQLMMIRKTPPPCFPPIVAGESVVWCKPGVVAKLMGLEAVPIPVRCCSTSSTRKDKWSSIRT